MGCGIVAQSRTAGLSWLWSRVNAHLSAAERAGASRALHSGRGESAVTVAAIIMVPDSAAALAEVEGEPVIRRVVQSAWAGGALPIVVVCAESGGPLDQVLAELPVTPAQPAPTEPRGIAWFVAGQRAAVQAVSETTACLLWPIRHSWVDPETVTSLVEAHGASPDSIIRPAYGARPGFPILVPYPLADRLAALSGMHGEEAIDSLIAAGVPSLTVELGDPGIVHDGATPRSSLPDYQGPPAPVPGSRTRDVGQLRNADEAVGATIGPALPTLENL
jgi:CTP:molybdopterin cytidylyltransferase MocA